MFIAWSAVLAAPADDQDDAKTSCLASPKGAPPAGERWFYRVERGTKRHCWYTRAAGEKRVAERPPQAAPAPRSAPPPSAAESALPEEPVRLDHSVANARAEANISATAAIAPPSASRNEPVRAEPPRSEPARTPPPSAWQMAERWSDHQNGGAPFDAKPAAPKPTMPTFTPAQTESEPDEMTTSNLLEIVGGAFGFAGLATALVMIFARRQQRKEASSDFALFATTDDPKRRLISRRAAHAPAGHLRPRLDRAEDAPSLHGHMDTDDDESTPPPIEGEDEPPMRPFAPRNMRMDRA